MNAQRRTPLGQASRRGFTLTELLVVIMVIGILSSTMLFAMYGATQQAKEARAQTQVVRLHDLLMTRWDSYRTRPVRLLQSPGLTSLPLAVRRDGAAMAMARLNAVRDLMRMEMPERVSDVVDGPVAVDQFYNYTNPYGAVMSGNVQITVLRPALSRAYARKATGTWSTAHQGSECLYLIVASIRDITGNGLDVLQDGEIGDTDGDGMLEILDPWGQPIEFLRWAPGYIASPGPDGSWGIAGTDDDGNGTDEDFREAGWSGSDDQPSITPMVLDAVEAPDPFNPLRVYPNKTTDVYPDDYPRNFALYPLIFSAGPDGKYDINVLGKDAMGNPFRYVNTTPRNNPYHVPPAPGAFPAGTPMDADADGELSFMDNITNHAIDTR